MSERRSAPGRAFSLIFSGGERRNGRQHQAWITQPHDSSIVLSLLSSVPDPNAGVIDVSAAIKIVSLFKDHADTDQHHQGCCSEFQGPHIVRNWQTFPWGILQSINKTKLRLSKIHTSFNREVA